MADSVPTTMTLHEAEAAGAPGVSNLKRWLASARGLTSAATRAKVHAVAAANGVRQGGESLLMGAALAAANVELKTGLDVRNVPIDAVAGGLGILGGVALAHTEAGTDLRNMGGAALAVFSFRKTQNFLAEKKRAKGQTPGFEVHGDDDEAFQPHGDIGEDPIVRAAGFL